MAKATKTISDGDAGNLSPELVPVFVAGEPELALVPLPALVLGSLRDFIADSLFREAIDVSDLLPAVVGSAPGEIPELELKMGTDPIDMAGDSIDLPDAFFAPTASLASFFDDDAKVATDL